MSRSFTAPILFLATALTLGGCGSGGSATTSAATIVSTRVTNAPKLHGRAVLVDSRGFTLYAFSRDPRNTLKSSCSGACASVWRPAGYEGGTLAAGGSVVVSELGTIKRSDGSLQVAYAGHPLYTYTLDRKPGDALGNGVSSFGGRWYALSPSGRPVPS
jgi:predicted lipoprotein with Yx(FWY)xxD motif